MAFLLFLGLLSNDLSNTYITRLDDPRWRVRDAAQRNLVFLGELARPALEKYYLNYTTNKRMTPETRRRILCTLYRLDHRQEEWVIKVADKILPVGWDRHPWLHLNNGWYGKATEPYVQAALQIVGYGQPKWNYWSYATKLWLRDRLRAGDLPSVLRAMVELMGVREKVWRKEETQGSDLNADGTFHW